MRSSGGSTATLGQPGSGAAIAVSRRTSGARGDRLELGISIGLGAGRAAPRQRGSRGARASPALFIPAIPGFVTACPCTVRPCAARRGMSDPDRVSLVEPEARRPRRTAGSACRPARTRDDFADYRGQALWLNAADGVPSDSASKCSVRRRRGAAVSELAVLRSSAGCAGAIRCPGEASEGGGSPLRVSYSPLTTWRRSPRAKAWTVSIEMRSILALASRVL